MKGSPPKQTLNRFFSQRNLNKEFHLISPPKLKQPLANIKQKVSCDFFIFQPYHYPFPNTKQKPFKGYKTTIEQTISNDHLHKFMELSHPNLINIQKIVRGYPKNYSIHQPSLYYSFYYQHVSFSLKSLVANHTSSGNLLKKLAGLDFKNILKHTSEYLICKGIYNIISLDDIGITQDSKIKIYVSPLIVTGDRNKKACVKTIYSSVDRLADWWKTITSTSQLTHSSHSNFLELPGSKGYLEEENQNNNSQLKSNKSSFIEKENSQIMGDDLEMKQHIQKEEKQRRGEHVNHIPHLRNSNSSFRTDLTKICSMQKQKIKKIDGDLRFIKDRLKEKQISKIKQSDNIFEKKRILNKNSFSHTNIFDSQRLMFKDNPQNTMKGCFGDKKCRDSSFQQNINCINIYNHPPKDMTSSIKKSKDFRLFSPNKINAKPIINYNFDRHKHEVHQDHQDQNLSVDTYEMEMGDHDLDHGNDNYRHTYTSEREVSEHNYKCKQVKQVHKNGVNKVTNKNITESAGPLQFKKIVNLFIKPQFQAKKSNIYEQPNEEQESQTSIKKLNNSKAQDLSHKQITRTNSFGCANQFSKHFQLPKNKKLLRSTEADIFKNSYLQRKKSDQYLPANKQLKAQKSDSYLNYRPSMQDQQISERVQIVLEKTKNAIALLNKAKKDKLQQQLKILGSS